ncbi:signal recognition particle receptor beta subunit-domain-containing protein [Neurospora hispaniola]|uniref:Signal recognition particle receptor subunit beta n=1 Tax=Neurospora hispaniola TaxID=588809 RepID=A0AAJ0IBG6_9PEZI|nr:signal recognition particle receptor beta subunit-domain-containing protein [Neurospora hispaniola]
MDTTIETITATVAAASSTPSASAPIKELIKDLLIASLQPNKTVIITGLLIVLLFPIFLHQVLHGNESGSSSKTSSLPSILLAGPSGAGKTALLTLFEKRAGRSISTSTNEKTEPAKTHTSQTPVSIKLNAAASPSSTSDDQPTKKKPFLLIDTPGHPKLRSTALSHLLPLDPKTGRPLPPSKSQPIKGVIFLLDASTLSPSSPDSSLSQAATYLYDLLLALQHRYSRYTKGSKHPPSIPVLIAANKLDLFTALPATLVKKELEAELGRIRVSRSKGLLDSGVKEEDDLMGNSKEEGDDWLGEYGSERFEFRQMVEFDIEVEVMGGSVLGGEEDGPGCEGWWSYGEDGRRKGYMWMGNGWVPSLSAANHDSKLKRIRDLQQKAPGGRTSARDRKGIRIRKNDQPPHAQLRKTIASRDMKHQVEN